ncbi:RNA polymerase subunit sigma-70 [Megasphaera cerevisiae DSM 20462]|uniref:RNA polymerase subunit sigma-70 n=3 Tax=Megasphaera TaxID=906 RepID=A0A0J6WU81_9FIRM|nr:RNA polymerase subunit sigma-70 [Megasphaera cerevisiae DSM 20462]
MELYFDMDWSLSEIGEELEISRQGVYDMLSRASKSLESYEQRLRLLARSDAVRSQLDHAGRLLEQGGPAQIEQAKKIIQEIEI